LDKHLRRILTFACEGAALAATLDEGPSTRGLLIVSGGNEIRVGAHRGMARLARDVARAGHPVFRFDRRGAGDSEGENARYAGSKADIEAALACFRASCPTLTHIVAFGNCDAATALVTHRIPVDARVLANPWVIEPVDELPSAPAIRARYTQRLRDPAAWAALLTGKIDLRGLSKGLGRLLTSSSADTTPLQQEIALHIADLPTTILLAERDNTAVTFRALWDTPVFDEARSRVTVMTLDSASHSFAVENDYATLRSVLLDALARGSPGGSLHP